MKDLLNNVSIEQNLSLERINEKQLIQIADLIYDTDKYISDALFVNRERAEVIIPELIRNDDCLFSLRNAILAICDEQIIGILLWNRGSLLWSSDLFISIVKDCGLPITDNIKKAEEEYFDTYSHLDESIATVMFLCVNPNMRNKGLGESLIMELISIISGWCKRVDLHVLEENKNAISLYRKMGFCSKETINGFSVDRRTLPCIKMVKTL